MNSYVYLITDGELTKVGYSDNPQLRLKGLQVSNPKSLRLAHVFTCHDRDSAMRLEKLIHQKYSKLQRSGEWFFANPDMIVSDVIWAIDISVTMNNVFITREIVVQKREQIKPYRFIKFVPRLLKSIQEFVSIIFPKKRLNPSITRSKPSIKLQKAIDYLNENPDKLTIPPRELETEMGMSYGTIFRAQQQIKQSANGHSEDSN